MIVVGSRIKFPARYWGWEEGVVLYVGETKYFVRTTTGKEWAISKDSEIEEAEA